MPRASPVPAAPPRYSRTPAAGTVEGRAAYQFQNTSGQGWTVCFGVDPGYDITSARANGAEVPPVRTGYEEYNMALWEIALPADEEIELILEYGGFPRDWNLSSTMQGSPEISESLPVPGKPAAVSLPAECAARRGGLSHHRGDHPARRHDWSFPSVPARRRWWRSTATAPRPGAMRTTAPAASSTPGTISARILRPAASPSSSTTAGSIRR